MNASVPPEGRFHLHHVVAMLGLLVVLGGLLLGWQTTADAARVDQALAQQARTEGERAEGASLRRAQILFLREARQRRLRNTSMLVVGVGLFGIIGAALMRRLRSEIVAWAETEEIGEFAGADEDPPDRKEAA